MSSSSRLTKHIREEITKLALRDAFEKELTTLLKERMKVIDVVYNSIFTPAERKALKAAPQDVLYKNRTLTFRSTVGHYLQMSFDGALPYCETLRDQGEVLLNKMRDPNDDYTRPMTRENPQRLLEDRKVQDMYDEHEAKLKDLTDKYVRARATLMAVLESVHTFKKLNVVWPEGLKYYSNFDADNTKPGLPAVMVDDLNKALGLK